MQLQRITNGNLGAEPPATGGYGSLGAKPAASGRFFVIFRKNSYCILMPLNQTLHILEPFERTNVLQLKPINLFNPPSTYNLSSKHV